MARPQKPGLEYFPLDTDMDDKFDLIEAEHSLLGFALLIKLYQKIYANGYYYNWTEKEQLLFSKRVSVDKETLESIVADAVKWDIFNKAMFEKYGILTSKGIQKRYITATYKRSDIEMYEEYLLIDVSKRKNISIVRVFDSKNPESSVVFDGNNPQSTVKESTVKESTVNENSTSSGIKDSDIDLSPTEPGEVPEEPKETNQPNIVETEAYKATIYLIDKIAANNSRARVPNKDPADKLMLDWVSEIEKLNRLGPPGAQNKGYPWPLIRKIIDWCQDNDFWKSAILSSAKFREKVVTLELQMKRPSVQSKGKKDAKKSNFTERDYDDQYIKDLERTLTKPTSRGG